MRIASQPLLHDFNGEELLWLAIHSNREMRTDIERVLELRAGGQALLSHKRSLRSASDKQPAGIDCRRS